MTDETGSKRWYKSKTVVVNLVTFMAALFAILAQGDFFDPKLMLMLSAIVNLVLRVWFTNTSLQ